MKTYSAFHNDPVRRQADIDRFEQDIAAERLVHVQTGQEGRGCFIWCTTPTREYAHEEFAAYYDVPIDLAHLLDRLFEGQRPARSRAWARRVLPAIQCGADTAPAIDRWFHWLMQWLITDSAAESSTDAPRRAIETVQTLYTRRLAGDEPTIEEWRTAEWRTAEYAADAACSAACSAARYATRYAARYAASRAAADADTAAAAARYAAGFATRYAARYATRYATRYAASSTAYSVMADQLIELLAGCPVNA